MQIHLNLNIPHGQSSSTRSLSLFFSLLHSLSTPLVWLFLNCAWNAHVGTCTYIVWPEKGGEVFNSFLGLKFKSQARTKHPVHCRQIQASIRFHVGKNRKTFWPGPNPHILCWPARLISHLSTYTPENQNADSDTRNVSWRLETHVLRKGNKKEKNNFMSLL